MTSRVDIESLTAEQRLALLEDIWDSLTPEDVPVTSAQRAELDRRLDDLEGAGNADAVGRRSSPPLTSKREVERIKPLSVACRQSGVSYPRGT